ncbi:hypothetical protein Cs7R123_42350 [Catellatospora sp. TT07R-123]|uniref:hypothetical protein n=1 Tax=Catellatospora sp. TT07R-123 TaxID=2733863 RepID=UPI001B23EFAE|nr:hypothetical protein [Catellatospora sp. TT07R-123]GHJ46893.1 hypothetical protein Cs7R123_42350 [Catellatospora sp. TT07R-123]
MTMTETTGKDIYARYAEAADTRDALRAQLEREGLPQVTRWLQRKVWRQARALDALNRRVTTQRFVLRTLDGLGRSLTADEFRTAKAAIANEQLRDRIDDPVG